MEGIVGDQRDIGLFVVDLSILFSDEVVVGQQSSHCRVIRCLERFVPFVFFGENCGRFLRLCCGLSHKQKDERYSKYSSVPHPS